MTNAELLGLIDRLEIATYADRKLDAAIDAMLRIGKPDDPGWKANRWIWNNFSKWRGREDGRVEVVHDDGSGGIHWEPAAYTASLDAARTLVPDGDPWTLGQNIHYRHWLACINEFKPDQSIGSRGEGHHPTSPAIALCIAALSARTTSNEPQQGTGLIVHKFQQREPAHG